MKANEFNGKLDDKSISILQEMSNYIPKKNSIDALSTRASHVIVSAISLLESFDKTCTVEEVEYLEKKLFNSIKSRDPEKFSRLLKKLKED